MRLGSIFFFCLLLSVSVPSCFSVSSQFLLLLRQFFILFFFKSTCSSSFKSLLSSCLCSTGHFFFFFFLWRWKHRPAGVKPGRLLEHRDSLASGGTCQTQHRILIFQETFPRGSFSVISSVDTFCHLRLHALILSWKRAVSSIRWFKMFGSCPQALARDRNVLKVPLTVCPQPPKPRHSEWNRCNEKTLQSINSHLSCLILNLCGKKRKKHLLIIADVN